MKKSSVSERLVIGVTGSFGTGKSTVANFFAGLGARCIDADEIVHRLLSSRGRIYKKIIAQFGRGVLAIDGSIDREKLGKMVFANQLLLNKLNALIHPEVIRIIRKRIDAVKAGVLVLDAPLLIEAGLRPLVDVLVVVSLPRWLQIKRLQRKTNLSRSDIIKRIQAQLPLKNKISLAGYVIDNSETRQKTKMQVVRIWKELTNK